MACLYVNGNEGQCQSRLEGSPIVQFSGDTLEFGDRYVLIGLSTCQSELHMIRMEDNDTLLFIRREADKLRSV